MTEQASPEKAAAQSSAPVPRPDPTLVRATLERAVPVPPAAFPLEDESTPSALPPDLRPAFLVQAPIRLYGIYQPYPGGVVYYLYRDAAGVHRMLTAIEHDKAGLLRLFAGAEARLQRLWPKPRAESGWDHEKASESLICIQGQIGSANARELRFIIGIPPHKHV